MALTFDDGPDPRSTPVFLGVLAEHQVSATFFMMLGRMLRAAPALGRELTDAGHEVAVHGWEHRRMLLRGPATAYDDLARAMDAIVRTTGTVPRRYRPPYGLLSEPARAARGTPSRSHPGGVDELGPRLHPYRHSRVRPRHGRTRT